MYKVSAGALGSPADIIGYGLAGATTPSAGVIRSIFRYQDIQWRGEGQGVCKSSESNQQKFRVGTSQSRGAQPRWGAKSN